MGISSLQDCSSRVSLGYASCAQVPLTESDDFLLIPAGEFRANDGRPRDTSTWRMDRAAAEQVIQKVSTRQRPVLVDYEHQTLESAKNGLPAPAAGWIQRLEWREGEGLYALDTEWTEKARAFLKSKEYRYISPVFTYSKHTGEIFDLLHVALTNVPALSQLPAMPQLAAAKYQQDSLHDQDLAVCNMMGIDPSDFIKTRNEEIEGLVELSQRHGLTTADLDVCEKMGINPADYLREASGTNR